MTDLILTEDDYRELVKCDDGTRPWADVDLTQALVMAGFVKAIIHHENAGYDRLHVEASQFAATACGDPGIAQRGASATRAAMVLSDLLQRADKRAGELAVAYDRARIAGLACERSFDSMRQ